MKLKKILSREMPEIDDSIKECVNLGQWLLFKPSSKIDDNDQACFYLKSGSKIFALTEQGAVIKVVEIPSGNLGIEELIYFADLPQPQSLSNAATSFAR